jgi:hypothetical protein
MMRFTPRLVLLAGIAFASSCGPAPDRQANAPAIKVRGAEQDRLHALGAFDLAIALKRAVYDAGYTCKQLTDGGFIGAYQNLDMWMAKCSEGREWAIFTGADGSAQVRDCRDVAKTGLPPCTIKRRPAGSFTEIGGSSPEKVPAKP